MVPWFPFGSYKPGWGGGGGRMSQSMYVRIPQHHNASSPPRECRSTLDLSLIFHRVIPSRCLDDADVASWGDGTAACLHRSRDVEGIWCGGVCAMGLTYRERTLRRARA